MNIELIDGREVYVDAVSPRARDVLYAEEWDGRAYVPEGMGLYLNESILIVSSPEIGEGFLITERIVEDDSMLLELRSVSPYFLGVRELAARVERDGDLVRIAFEDSVDFWDFVDGKTFRVKPLER